MMPIMLQMSTVLPFCMWTSDSDSDAHTYNKTNTQYMVEQGVELGVTTVRWDSCHYRLRLLYFHIDIVDIDVLSFTVQRQLLGPLAAIPARSGILAMPASFRRPRTMFNGTAYTYI